MAQQLLYRPQEHTFLEFEALCLEFNKGSKLFNMIPLMCVKFMSYHGDEEYFYTDNDKKRIKELVDMIVKKLKGGYTLYGAVKGGDPTRIADANTVKEKDVENNLKNLDRFMMSKVMEKKMLAPYTGGG